jgi:hypothetical protein
VLSNSSIADSAVSTTSSSTGNTLASSGRGPRRR